MARGRGAGDGDPFLQLRGEALNPAVHGRVIHRDAPVGEHGLEVAVADRDCRYQRTAQRITSAGKRKPRNTRAVVMDGILGRVVAGVLLLPGHAAPLNATEPR